MKRSNYANLIYETIFIKSLFCYFDFQAKLLSQSVNVNLFLVRSDDEKSAQKPVQRPVRQIKRGPHFRKQDQSYSKTSSSSLSESEWTNNKYKRQGSKKPCSTLKQINTNEVKNSDANKNTSQVQDAATSFFRYVYSLIESFNKTNAGQLEEGKQFQLESRHLTVSFLFNLIF